MQRLVRLPGARCLLWLSYVLVRRLCGIYHNDRKHRGLLRNLDKISNANCRLPPAASRRTVGILGGKNYNGTAALKGMLQVRQAAPEEKYARKIIL